MLTNCSYLIKNTLLEEKVLYRTLKGSISEHYVFGTPKRFYTEPILRVQ